MPVTLVHSLAVTDMYCTHYKILHPTVMCSYPTVHYFGGRLNGMIFFSLFSKKNRIHKSDSTAGSSRPIRDRLVFKARLR